MPIECLVHLGRARLKSLQQISVARLEILQNFRQPPCSHSWFEGRQSVDNRIAPGFVGWVEMAWLGRRFKRSYDHSGWVWVEMQRLAIRELGL